jgi:hypothetical protein
LLAFIGIVMGITIIEERKTGAYWMRYATCRARALALSATARRRS